MSENWSWEAKVVEVKLNITSLLNWLHRPSQLCSLLKGWIIPNPLTQIPWTSKIKHFKAGIVLVIWVTFLALAFWCTLPPMVRPIVDGVFGWTINSQPTMWEARHLPSRVKVAGCIVHAHSRRSPLKGGNIVCACSTCSLCVCVCVRERESPLTLNS